MVTSTNFVVFDVCILSLMPFHYSFDGRIHREWIEEDCLKSNGKRSCVGEMRTNEIFDAPTLGCQSMCIFVSTA